MSRDLLDAGTHKEARDQGLNGRQMLLHLAADDLCVRRTFLHMINSSHCLAINILLDHGVLLIRPGWFVDVTDARWSFIKGVSEVKYQRCILPLMRAIEAQEAMRDPILNGHRFLVCFFPLQTGSGPLISFTVLRCESIY